MSWNLLFFNVKNRNKWKVTIWEINQSITHPFTHSLNQPLARSINRSLTQSINKSTDGLTYMFAVSVCVVRSPACPEITVHATLLRILFATHEHHYRADQSINVSIKQVIISDESMNQKINQPQPIIQSIVYSQSTDLSTNKSIKNNKSTNQAHSINQAQSINHSYTVKQNDQWITVIGTFYMFNRN